MKSCLIYEILSSWEAKLGEGAGQEKGQARGRSASTEELVPVSRSALHFLR